MRQLQYLFVLLAVVVATLPLELVCGARVWRQPQRLVIALAPVVAMFTAWDLAATAHGTWSFDSAYVVGLQLPGGLPIEELLFFVIVPIAGLLTREALRRARVSSLSQRGC